MEMMQQMQVTVPAGVGPGMPFQVNTPTGPMQVTCPPNVTAGGQMLVNVPAAPQPVVMATAVPAQPVAMAVPAQPMMAAPQPMVMQQPMMGQPPMGQPMAFGAGGGGLPWKLSLAPAEKGALFAVKEGGQSPIPVISANEWREIMEALDAVMHANFFYDCPACECVYYCIPGGPIQCVLCMLNPVTCIVCFGPVESAKKAAKAKIEPIIGKYGLKLRFADTMNGLEAIIEQ